MEARAGGRSYACEAAVSRAVMLQLPGLLRVRPCPLRPACAHRRRCNDASPCRVASRMLCPAVHCVCLIPGLGTVGCSLAAGVSGHNHAKKAAKRTRTR